jgi:hypothetical protein
MLAKFADRYRLRVRRNSEDGTEILEGRRGHIFEYSTTELGVLYMPGLKHGRGIGTWHPKIWNRFCEDAGKCGMTIRQRGDSEGTISFNPENTEQAKLTIKIARAKTKRVITPERAAKLAANLSKFRSNRPQEPAYSV